MRKSKLAGLICTAMLAMAATAGAAEYQTQGLDSPDRTLPVFYESLRAKMAFKLGWTDQVKNPAAWKKAGLAKAREIMLPAWQDKTAFEPKVLEEIDRGSYVARKVVFNLTAESRVMALVLVLPLDPKSTPLLIMKREAEAGDAIAPQIINAAKVFLNMISSVIYREPMARSEFIKHLACHPKNKPGKNRSTSCF